MQNVGKVWKDENAQQLVEALLSIPDKLTMQNFLRDVMTEKEISEISARLEAARMLTDGRRYTDIVAKTKLSSRTVAHVLVNGFKTAVMAIKLH